MSEKKNPRILVSKREMKRYLGFFQEAAKIVEQPNEVRDLWSIWLACEELIWSGQSTPEKLSRNRLLELTGLSMARLLRLMGIYRWVEQRAGGKAFVREQRARERADRARSAKIASEEGSNPFEVEDDDGSTS